ASGTVALSIASRALREGEIDAAIVGAVDLSDEPVHRAALAAIGAGTKTGDAAVVLVLKRLDDARRDGDPVLALLDGEGAPVSRIGDGEGAIDPAPHGRAHAASGLVHIAAAVWSVHHGARITPSRGATPWFGERVAEATAHSIDGAITSTR